MMEWSSTCECVDAGLDRRCLSVAPQASSSGASSGCSGGAPKPARMVGDRKAVVGNRAEDE